jgi:tripartite-type tricarboxylate transporter receptor subunit TctC
MSKLNRRVVLGGLATAATMRPQRAFAAWPDHNVTLMHGLAPGGGVDVSCRVVADGLTRRLGQQFVVEPKPGAAGTLMAAQVARTTPDGYTLGYIPGGFAVSAAMYKALPYRPLDDFAFIGQVLDFPFVVVTYAGHSIHNIADVIKTAKTRSEPLLCGVPGQGTPQHLLIEYFSRLAGIKVQPVPFRGGNLALNELMGKRLDFLIDPPITLIGQIKAGTLQAIAVTSDTRFPDLPDVGTIAEAGFPGFSVTSWMGLMGPAKLPADIVGKLNGEINALVKEPAVIERIKALGSEPKAGSPEDFRRLIADEVSRWNKVIAEAGIERI